MKIDTPSIVKQYEENRKTYENLAESVRYLLSEHITARGIKIHSISDRIKEIGSLIDKIRRKRIENPFDQIHDLVGFRVVCLFLIDLEAIREVIEEEFEVFEKDDKVNETELDIFGYMSLHLKAKLKSSFESPFGENIKKIAFEIQVRTIAQDAWASISHYLDYKKDGAIPRLLKRDFYALSGLFYVADTHFSFIRQKQSTQFFNENKK